MKVSKKAKRSPFKEVQSQSSLFISTRFYLTLNRREREREKEKEQKQKRKANPFFLFSCINGDLSLTTEGRWKPMRSKLNWQISPKTKTKGKIIKIIWFTILLSIIRAEFPTEDPPAFGKLPSSSSVTEYFLFFSFFLFNINPLNA